MPRQTSSNHSSNHSRPLTSQSFPRPTNPPVNLPAPKLWHQAPQTGVPMMQTIKEGFGFGAGSAVAQRIVGGIFGPSYPPQAQYTASAPLNQPFTREYAQCILMNEKNQGVCQPFLSKDKSIWKECMESNAYDAELCKGTQ